jgi:hypothetical protein
MTYIEILQLQLDLAMNALEIVSNLNISNKEVREISQNTLREIKELEDPQLFLREKK